MPLEDLDNPDLVNIDEDLFMRELIIIGHTSHIKAQVWGAQQSLSSIRLNR